MSGTSPEPWPYGPPAQPWPAGAAGTGRPDPGVADPGRPALDRAVAATRADRPPAAWGRAAGGAVGGLVGLLVLLGLGAGAVRVGQQAAAAASLVAELCLGGVVFVAGRPVAARHGGWRRAFGLAVPGLRDGAVGIGWFVVQMVARAAGAVVLALLLPSFRFSTASNTTGLLHARVGTVVLLGLAAVVVAPVVEEAMFRGLLLRALMRRTGFWPAALASSVLFGLFHSYEASSGWGALTLGVLMALFGLLQCLLVRMSGRLGAAMVAHGASNLLAVVVASGG